MTPFGVFHTAVGVVALVCGFIAPARDKEISARNRLGQVYLVTTLITAVTALGIFHQGGWGPPHVLAVLTLVAPAVGTVAATSERFGRASRYVQVIEVGVDLDLAVVKVQNKGQGRRALAAGGGPP